MKADFLVTLILFSHTLFCQVDFNLHFNLSCISNGQSTCMMAIVSFIFKISFSHNYLYYHFELLQPQLLETRKIIHLFFQILEMVSKHHKTSSISINFNVFFYSIFTQKENKSIIRYFAINSLNGLGRDANVEQQFPILQKNFKCQQQNVLLSFQVKWCIITELAILFQQQYINQVPLKNIFIYQITTIVEGGNLLLLKKKCLTNECLV